MEKLLIEQRFSQAFSTYDANGTVQESMAGHLLQLMHTYVPIEQVNTILEAGCGTGKLTRGLYSQFQPQTLFANDLCECSAQYVRNIGPEVEFLHGDIEQTPLPNEIDLFASSATVQWLESPINFITKLHNYLSHKSGYVAISTFSPNNLPEIAQVCGTKLNYPSLSHWMTQLQEHYHIHYQEQGVVCCMFDSAIDVLHHLKSTGVNGVRRQKWTKGHLREFVDQYHKLFTQQDGRVSLTYAPCYLILQKR